MSTLNIEQQIETKDLEICNIENQIQGLQLKLDNFEYEVSESEFDEFLDDCYDAVTVAGMEFCPSDVLKSCDPVAYRCAKADYESNYDLDDCEEYQDLKQELEELENQLEDLESDLEALQNQLDSLESED